MQIYAQKNATLQSALYFTHFYDNFNPLTRLSLIDPNCYSIGAIVLETLCSPMLFQ